MKTLFTIFILLCLQQSSHPCGGEDRWDVKILKDKEAKQINFTPKFSTVDSLMQMKVSQKIGNSTKRFDQEFNTYRIVCRVREYRKEEDGDYHLVLFDLKDSTKTIIGEIPNPDCSKGSKYIKNFSACREYFEKNLIVKKNTTNNSICQISGVCFFDKIHGQLGVAPNGVELHPILSIKSVQ